MKKIKSAIFQATIFTDIIIGFTGETEEQFQNAIKAFDESIIGKFCKVNIISNAAFLLGGDLINEESKILV